MMCHTKLINNAILFFFRRENGLQSKALFLVKISFLPFDFILYNVISQLNLNHNFLLQSMIKFLYRFSDISFGNGLHYILHYHEFVIYVGVTYTNVYIRITINCLAQTRVSTFLELYIFNWIGLIKLQGKILKIVFLNNRDKDSKKKSKGTNFFIWIIHFIDRFKSFETKISTSYGYHPWSHFHS